MKETMEQCEKEEQIGEEVLDPFLDAVPGSNEATPKQQADCTKVKACSIVLNRDECHVEK